MPASFGDAAPVGLIGFALGNTPATLMLLGWFGAGGSDGNEAAAVGFFLFSGCVLEILAGVGEWIKGATFNAAVFLSLGAYFGAMAATMIPSSNASLGYGTDAAAVTAYHASYAVLLLGMGALLLIFTIASTRVDMCHVLLFACFTVCFPCLAASHFQTAAGQTGRAETLRMCGAVTSMIGTVVVWYLILASILLSVDFPWILPVGDLRNVTSGRSGRMRSEC